MKINVEAILAGMRLAMAAMEAWKESGNDTVEISDEMVQKLKVDPGKLQKMLEQLPVE